MSINTMNDFGVTIAGDQVVVQLPLRRLDRQEALRLAVWLKCMAEFLPPRPDDPTFDQIYQAVMNT